MKATDRHGRTVAEVISEINGVLVLGVDGQAFTCRQCLSCSNATEYRAARFTFSSACASTIAGSPDEYYCPII